MESKLFKSQIISLVLCFLDHMNVEGWNILQRNLIGLEFPRSLNLGRFYSFERMLFKLGNFPTLKIYNILWWVFYYINDVFIDRTTVQNFRHYFALDEFSKSKVVFTSRLDIFFQLFA
jgi:hypothetical protein